VNGSCCSFMHPSSSVVEHNGSYLFLSAKGLDVAQLEAAAVAGVETETGAVEAEFPADVFAVDCRADCFT